MATYQFSALADGQTISFNPNADVLFFDQSAISAANVTAVTEGGVVHVNAFGKNIFLSGISAPQLATSNTTFANGTQLLFGDNTPGTANDNAANSLVGTAGDDHLKGFGGADTLNGGAGNDLYEVSTGDVISDSGGIDAVRTDVSWTLGSGLEYLHLEGSGNISAGGNNLNNFIEGNAGNNYVNARGGNDTIFGGAGNDTVDMSTGGTGLQGNDVVGGMAGIDTLDYDGYALSAVNADLHAGIVTGGGQGGEGEAHVAGFERFIGGAFDDAIRGDNTANYLDGRGGNDLLDGRWNNDTLIGGAGVETFVFSVEPTAFNADLVTGFVSNTDRLHFDAGAHSGIGANGRFASADPRFWSSGSGTAHDASDRVIYNTSTGQLWYDADGSGSGEALLVATLQGAPVLLATDVHVVNGTPPGATINGTSGDDSLTGTAFDDTINGLAGNDTIRGVDGSDNLNGGDGNDYLEGQGDSVSHGGNPGADLLIGGAGDDTLDGALSETQFEAFTADTLDGGLGNDVFHVDGGGDTLIDAGGVDTVVVHQLDGWTLADGYENLQLFDSEGQSSMFGIGNAANNVIEAVQVRHARLEGLAGNDLLIGTSSADTLLGGEGNDTIRGLENGFDSIDGGAGDDLVSGVGNLAGGAGNDTLNGGIDGGTLAGGVGLDVFVYDQALPFSINPFSIGDFASGSDTIRLDALALPGLGASGRMAAGDGRFYAAPGATSGHDADDRVVFNTTTRELFYDADGSGSQAAGRLFTLQPGATLAATDIEIINGSAPSGGTINGTAGNDSLIGTAGNDTINGLAGNDTLRGLGGDDSLDGGLGIDSMDGGSGNDTYVAGAGDILVEAAGAGTDEVQTNVSWTLADNFENLTLLAGGVTANGNNANNVLRGNDANNTSINGRAGNDTMFGMGGNDVFDMSAGGTSSYGSDVIDGGAGTDSVEFGNNSQSAVNINLTAGTASGGGSGGAGSASLTSVENALGGNFNDTLTGSSGANLLRGWNGNDTLNGKAGVDVLNGGAGNDAFVFDMLGSANRDIVQDFASGVDKLHMENAVMTAIGATGNFAAGDARFWASTAGTAHDANDRILYNTASGDLFYDADGNGSGGAQFLGNISGHPSLAATDIAVI